MKLGSWGFFADSLHRQRVEEDLVEALQGAIEMYYGNYTDATHLEGDFLQAMETLSYETGLNFDIESLVREAEEAINREGGVKGSDGIAHQVSTYGDEV